MKKSVFAFLFLMFILSFSAVSAETLTVGTSAEYRPFVYYDYNNELTGLDIDLIKEIGSREGFDVRIMDMAFDGLIDSAEIGQIDLIASAYSITPERKERLLFSNKYYTNAAVIIASVQSSITNDLKLDSITSYRLGVQRGSSFDQWIKTNLVGEGLVNTQNVYSFSTIDSAVKALQNGTIDLLMFDEITYQNTYRDSGRFKIVNNDMGDEEYGIAAALGKEELIARINDGLEKMAADGSLDTLISKYTDAAGDAAEITIARPSQVISREQTVLPTPTPIPPVDQPANCKNVMVYMADVSYPDGSKINPGENFTKTWRIYNNGSCKWYEGYTIEYIDGDFMSGRSTIIPSLTIPGTTVDVGINLQAPQAPGSYVGYYQLRAPDGTYFGPKLTVKIIVTTDYVTEPAVGAPPLITRFQPNYYKGGKKFCPTIYWTVSDASQIRISINNKPVYTTVQGSGSVELCPGGGKGNYVYGLVAEGTKRASVVFTYTNTGE